jgi:excisionase family DNA binding protein
MSVAMTTAKPKRVKVPTRPLLETNRNYDRSEAALAVGVSVPTLIRAFESGHLKFYRIGRRVIHSGQHLLDWLESGGRTSNLIKG